MIDLRELECPDDSALLESMLGIIEQCTLSAADELGVFGALAGKAQTARGLAEMQGLNVEGTLALCRVLVANKWLCAHAGADGEDARIDFFSLSEASRAYWLSTSALYRGEELKQRRRYPDHQRIVEALRQSEADNPITEMWRRGALEPDVARHFTSEMHSLALASAIMEVRSGAYQDVKHIVDVGGGSGAFCAALVAHHPDVKATLLDLPPVISNARVIVERYVAEGVHFLACNFFEDPLPNQGDAIRLGNVLHDWPPEACKRILNACFEALPSGGRLYVHEALLSEDGFEPKAVTVFNLSMFLNHRSQQFSLSQLTSLLVEVGFELEAAPKHRFGYYALVVAKKQPR